MIFLTLRFERAIILRIVSLRKIVILYKNVIRADLAFQ